MLITQRNAQTAILVKINFIMMAAATGDGIFFHMFLVGKDYDPFFMFRIDGVVHLYSRILFGACDLDWCNFWFFYRWFFCFFIFAF